jgi:hypothetical protein
MEEILRKAKFISFASSSCFASRLCSEDCQRALVHESVFFPLSVSLHAYHIQYITIGPLVAAVQRHSLAPTDIIIIIIRIT